MAVLLIAGGDATVVGGDETVVGGDATVASAVCSGGRYLLPQALLVLLLMALGRWAAPATLTAHFVAVVTDSCGSDTCLWWRTLGTTAWLRRSCGFNGNSKF